MSIDVYLGPMAWSELLNHIDRSNVVEVVHDALKRLNFRTDFTKVLKGPFLYDDTMKNIMPIVGGFASQNGVLKRDLIFEALNFMRGNIGRAVVSATRRCYNDLLKYNECLYDMRITSLEDAVKRDLETIDVRFIEDMWKKWVKDDDDTFQENFTCDRLVKDLRDDFAGIQGMNHVTALQKRYRSISPMLQRAEWIVNRRPKSVAVHF